MGRGQQREMEWDILLCGMKAEGWTIWGRKETTKKGKVCEGGKWLKKKKLKRKKSCRHAASHGLRAEQAVPCCPGYQVTSLHIECLFGVGFLLSLLYLMREFQW